RQGAVQADEQPVKVLDKAHRGAQQLGVETHPEGQVAGLIGQAAGDGIHRLFDDQLRGAGRHLFNLHTAGGAHHDHGTAKVGSGNNPRDKSWAVPWACSTRTWLTTLPSGPVWGVIRVIPRIWPASRSTSWAVAAVLMPPPLPRPPAWIWALTTKGPAGRVSATWRAWAGVPATAPSGTGTWNFRSNSLA